ncbi:Tubulin-specific chaperone D [Seminavis robusta]|uniref:Tubulin-specific chaperone D n=1 Tax=Seminavis robusta TaxID=568900 RepID=A0A9N8HX64_9STRA|nr:Tubulin-specific chaperone D [Seminavis robusta]|eukprot:Sro2397_g326050.1 Tubulin-specific chaperone D (1262) ;mRNA; f:1471-5613
MSAVSEDNLFVEREETQKLVAILTNTESSDDNEKDAALVRLRQIFDNYLECPTLLRYDVRNIVTDLLEVARKTIGKTGDESIIPFHHCSHALSAIYALSKVRGRKDIQRLLSHEVEDLEPVLRALQQLQREDNNNLQHFSGDSDQRPQRWESLYVLWNWVETLSLVPFHCSALFADSNSVVSSLIDLGKAQLSQTGPTREAAASSLAAWVSRPDLESTQIPEFVQWSRRILLEQCNHQTLRHSDAFLLLGVIQTLVRIIKVCSSSRDKVMDYMSALWPVFLRLEHLNVCDNNLLLRKFMVKWWARMGCIYLPPNITQWRYQRGRRSLADNLAMKGPSQATDTPSVQETGDSTESLTRHGPQHTDDELDLLWHVPDEVEDAMGFIQHKLRDPATMVRWAAAKGVGRLTARLPSICADDVLDAILEMFVDQEADQAWHGACLALAELARRGLLLPHRLSQLVPMIVRAIQYDVVRGQSSVGAHVRDAACYTYWSFARAYEPTILKPYVSTLSESIILTCLFDREVNCRRAASAAFQECVGRQGADSFKHGISILTVADYFSLGNRKDAYTKIALHVAQFPEYRTNIVKHVYRVKLHHWDPNIRQLASESLHGLIFLDPKYVIDYALPYLLKASLDPKDIPMRHGAILGLAESILALGKQVAAIQDSVPDNLLNEIRDIVTAIEKNRLYRGRGGEIVRAAVCRLICCICAAKIPLVARQQVRLLDSIDACLPHPNETIQEKACEALRELTLNYFPVGPNGPSDRLQKRVVDRYLHTAKTCENPASTRGFALALGYLPAKLLAPSPLVLDSVITVLRKVARHNATVGGERDAATRRNALIALKRVCQTVGLEGNLRSSGGGCVGLDCKLVDAVFETFLKGLVDYNMDRRGDVGSWCRIEAMNGLEAMAYLAVEQGSQESVPQLFSHDLAKKTVSGMLKQFCEKLDSVRVEAGGCLERILTKEDPRVPSIPEHEFLQRCFGLEQHEGDAEESKQVVGTTNWADASVTFPMVAKASKVDEYFAAILSGMVISVGGLTESISKESSAALLQLAKEARGTPRITTLGNVLLDLFHTHSRDGRVTLPLLKTIETLLSHQCLDELLKDVEECGFKKSLLRHISNEAKNCRDIHRHFACIDVALGLVGPPSDGVVEDALAFVCAQLVHSFPRVRRYAAEQLYVCLLEHPEYWVGSGDDESSMEDLLLEFAWDDSNRKATHCREMAQKVSNAIGVPLVLPDQPSLKDATNKKQPRQRDDFASYAALVGAVKQS